MHEQCATERKGAEFRGTEHILFELHLEYNFERNVASARAALGARPSGNLKRSGGTGASPNRHSDRTGALGRHEGQVRSAIF